MISSDTQILR